MLQFFLWASCFANLSFLKTVQKSKKSYKNSKFFKNDGHFRITHPQISLKQYSNIFENVVYFLD